MSVVTGVMLICALADGDDDPDSTAISEIQSWLSDAHWGQQLREISGHSGGGKAPQFAAFCGGFNYMRDREEEFAHFVTTRTWAEPAEMVLVLRPENGPCKVYRADPSVPPLEYEWDDDS